MASKPLSSVARKKRIQHINIPRRHKRPLCAYPSKVRWVRAWTSRSSFWRSSPKRDAKARISARLLLFMVSMLNFASNYFIQQQHTHTINLAEIDGVEGGCRDPAIVSWDASMDIHLGRCILHVYLLKCRRSKNETRRQLFPTSVFIVKGI